MNRKFVIRVILPILIIVELSFLFLTYVSYSNKNVDKIKEVSKIDKKMFAMYVMDDNGDYQEVTNSEYWPSSNYKLNTTKSSCVDTKGKSVSTNVLNYSDGKLTVSSNQTLFCYLYFDIKVDIRINVTTNGTSGLPTINKYKAELTCNDATATYSNKYHRIEFNTVTSDGVNCNLNYVNDPTNFTLLTTEIANKRTLSTNQSGLCSNETFTTSSSCTSAGGHWYYVSSVTGSEGEDAGIRYSGKQPNNWVWFNNELWRIIGSIPTCMDSSCTIKPNLVKIMRAESLGRLEYHSSFKNAVWGGTGSESTESILYTLLNKYYYGKKDATSTSSLTDTPCKHSGYALCNYTNKGISDDSNDYYGRMIENVYMNVGSVSGTATIGIDALYTLETATLTSNAITIGLMNASDYGYAISDITYSDTNLGRYISVINNWIYGNGYEWTMTPSGTNRVYRVYNSGDTGVLGAGSVSNNNVDYGSYNFRPVVYLDSSVYIISGNGAENNPYILGM